MPPRKSSHRTKIEPPRSIHVSFYRGRYRPAASCQETPCRPMPLKKRWPSSNRIVRHATAPTETVRCQPIQSSPASIREYMLKQLKEFKSGARRNPVMASMLGNLVDEDLSLLASHYSAQNSASSSAKDKSLALQGRAIYPRRSCVEGGSGLLGMPFAQWRRNSCAVSAPRQTTRRICCCTTESISCRRTQQRSEPHDADRPWQT